MSGFSVEDLLIALTEFDDTFMVKVKPLIKSEEMQRNFYNSLFRLLLDDEDFRTRFIMYDGDFDHIRLDNKGMIIEVWSENYGMIVNKVRE